MTRIARLRRVHRPLRLVQVLAVTDDGLARPQAGGSPLVVEVGGDPSFHLLPVAEIERGPVQEMVVRSGEAVDQVEREAAHEGGQRVLRHPPHLVREEGGGKCTRNKTGVISADDGVEEALFQPHIEVSFGNGDLHSDEFG